MLRRTLHVFRHRDRWTVREGNFVYATTATLADAEASAKLAGGPYAIICFHGLGRPGLAPPSAAGRARRERQRPSTVATSTATPPIAEVT